MTDFLEQSGYKVKNFDFIGKRLKFQFTRVIYILFKIFSVIKQRPKCLLIGGGQLLLKNRNFPYALLGWYLVSKLTRVPIIAYSVGVEQTQKTNVFYRWVIKLFLSHAKQVFLRDTLSVTLVEQLTGLHFDTVPDAAYLSYSPDVEYDTEKKHAVVFVSANSVAKHEITHHYRRIDTVLQKNAIRSFIVSSSSEQDAKAATGFFDYAQQLNLNVHLELAANFEQFIKQISGASIVVSSRMHPLIFAHILGKPFIPIPTNNKTLSMSEFLSKNSPESLSVEAKSKLLKSLEQFAR
ncbi:MAG: polysaccharide pyruvyl transferase family protein [Methylophaga sp.]|nr:polysaccharide pyruvyl transferase family protein [Methylophaga sp.]